MYYKNVEITFFLNITILDINYHKKRSNYYGIFLFWRRPDSRPIVLLASSYSPTTYILEYTDIKWWNNNILCLCTYLKLTLEYLGTLLGS